jgi:hypothetical protein
MKKKTTTDAQSYARAYIDSALESRERLGRASKVSREDYETAVQRATSAFNDLLEVRTRDRNAALPDSN